jgi:uncharacterized protein GlcG (DUF336 family)
MLRLWTLDLSDARKAIDAIILKATQDQGPPVAITVASVTGTTIMTVAMDGVKDASVPVSANKAYTAVKMACDTIELADRTIPLDATNLGDPRACTFGGAVIVTSSGRVVGAIGVSGRKAFHKKEETYAYATDHDLATHGRQRLEQD